MRNNSMSDSDVNFVLSHVNDKSSHDYSGVCFKRYGFLFTVFPSNNFTVNEIAYSGFAVIVGIDMHVISEESYQNGVLHVPKAIFIDGRRTDAQGWFVVSAIADNLLHRSVVETNNIFPNGFEIDIPPSVIYVGRSSFAGLPINGTVNIPNALIVGRGAFLETNIDEVSVNQAIWNQPNTFPSGTRICVVF